MLNITNTTPAPADYYDWSWEKFIFACSVVGITAAVVIFISTIGGGISVVKKHGGAEGVGNYQSDPQNCTCDEVEMAGLSSASSDTTLDAVNA